MCGARGRAAIRQGGLKASKIGMMNEAFRHGSRCESVEY